MLKNKRYLVAAASLVLIFLVSNIKVGAAQLGAGNELDLSRLSVGATPDLFVAVKLNTTPTAVAKIVICFPSKNSAGAGSGFTVASGTPTATGSANTGNTPTTTPLPGTLSAASSTSVTLCPGAAAGWAGSVVVSTTSTTMNNTTLYGFTVTGAGVTNPSAVAQYNTLIASASSAPATIDSTTTPVYTTTSNGDQVAVNASVAPNFTFSLSANTDTIPAVDPSSVQTSPGVNMNVSTNSPLGYTAYVKSASNKLASATQTATPICTGSPTCTSTFDGTPDNIVAGVTKYGFAPYAVGTQPNSSGTVTFDPEYNIAQADTTHSGGFNGTNFSSFEERNGYTQNDTIKLQERDAVSNSVAYANDYTDTLTVVAAGNF